MSPYLRRLTLAALLCFGALSAGAEDDAAADMARKEGPMAHLSARFAYNSEEALLVGLGFRTDRLFGADQALRVDAEASRQ
jgi:hypothetical protein